MSEERQSPEAPVQVGKKRPRIDFSAALGGGGGGGNDGKDRDRKRGRSMFGMLVGTLNKAKTEDVERGKSDAAKKRAEIDERLQSKLRSETESVRKQDEAKKDKGAAVRREEELVLRDSVMRMRLIRLPTLANFLITTDEVLSSNTKDDDESMEPAFPDKETAPDGEDVPMQDDAVKTKPPPTGPKGDILRSVQAPRRHPPPIYYRPKILLHEQEAFIEKRKAEVKKAVDAEWTAFQAEKAKAMEEIAEMRKKSQQVLEEVKASKADDDEGEDADDLGRNRKRRKTDTGPDEAENRDDGDAKMDVEGEADGKKAVDDGDDAVVY